MLIQCPNCGKPVNDKAHECIHCKHQLNAQISTAQTIDNTEQPATDYKSLSREEKKNLLAKFAKEQPKKAGTLKKTFTFERLGLWLVASGSLCALLSFIFFTENESAPKFILFATMLVSGVLMIFLSLIFTLTAVAVAKKGSDAGRHFTEWAKKRNILNTKLPLFFTQYQKRKKLLAHCPNCGNKTALLNDICEHCGCKTKTCIKCGNVVEESCTVCSYCEFNFSTMEQMQENEETKQRITKIKRDASMLSYYAEEMQRKNVKTHQILSAISFIPWIVLLIAAVAESLILLDFALILLPTMFVVISTIEELIAQIMFIKTENVILQKARELNIDVQGYIDTLSITPKGKILFNALIGHATHQQIVVNTLRTENHSITLKIVRAVFCILIQPFAKSFLILGAIPFLLSCANPSTPNFELLLNVYLLLFILLEVAMIFIRADVNPKKNAEWVKQVQTKK